jgi:hypothetical protein
VICERRETDHFQHCIGEHEEPMTAGATGLRVVEILQAAWQSMAQHGRPVDLRLTALEAAA